MSVLELQKFLHQHFLLYHHQRVAFPSLVQLLLHFSHFDLLEIILSLQNLVLIEVTFGLPHKELPIPIDLFPKQLSQRREHFLGLLVDLGLSSFQVENLIEERPDLVQDLEDLLSFLLAGHDPFLDGGFTLLQKHDKLLVFFFILLNFLQEVLFSFVGVLIEGGFVRI